MFLLKIYIQKYFCFFIKLLEQVSAKKQLNFCSYYFLRFQNNGTLRLGQVITIITGRQLLLLEMASKKYAYNT